MELHENSADDGFVQQRKKKRGKRGGGGKEKKNVNNPTEFLSNEIFKYLKSNGVTITPAAQKSKKKEENKIVVSDAAVKIIVPAIIKAVLTLNKPKEPGLGGNVATIANATMPKKKGQKLVPVLANLSNAKKLQKGVHGSPIKKPVESTKLKKGKTNNKLPMEVSDKKHAKCLIQKSKIIKKKEQNIVKKIPAEDNFAKYIQKREMLELLLQQDVKNPFYAKGTIRISSKNTENAYVDVNDREDILIVGLRDRNRALESDVVAIKIKPQAEWIKCENNKYQKTGTVVCILEKMHLRQVVGTLQLHNNRVRLMSRDPRVPPVYIDRIDDKIQENPMAYKNTLFLAKICEWRYPYVCTGAIQRILGQVGDLESETEAILLSNGLDVTPYDEELTEGYPSSDYKPTDEDIKDREDWRQECVFTIDPATAVDLDDAVSCKKLSNGNYQIGVHISDVTTYLKAFSPLDNEVSKRATTVYLANTVYHMLPKSLCQLCSLLPGHDKLSFSVIWEMTPKAEVVNHRFTKSIINSCYQMAYEEAQAMIDEPSKEWSKADLKRPDSLKGEKYSPKNLCETVNDLYKLSAQMRAKRYADGALSINQTKLQMILDPETKLPISYCLEERQDSNRLIEEFMLLANMTVAKHLYETLPDTALLRIHGTPVRRVLTRTAEDLGHLGVHLNTKTAGTLQSSLDLYEKTGLEGEDQRFVTSCRMMVINTLCAQAMPRANYVCSASIKDEKDLRHFALNVPFYTHFTSPIRRYADCAVHRLLYASMTNSLLPTEWSSELCAKISANCNGKKYSAKIAQEKSNQLYFISLLAEKGSTETIAIVMKVSQSRLDVILCHVGITVTISTSTIQKEAEIEYSNEHSVPTLIVKWKKTEIVQVINVFSMINLTIEKHPKSYTVRALLLPPRVNA